MRFSILLTLGTVLLANASEAPAQETLPLPAGSRIKVAASPDGRAVVGTLLAIDDSTLSIRPVDSSAPVEFHRSSITSLAVGDGRHSRWRKGLVGFGIGAVTGFLLGYASGDDEHGAWDFVWFSAEEKGLLLAAVLAPIGGVVGLALRPGDRWRDVPIESLRIAPHVTSAGEAGLAVTLRF